MTISKIMILQGVLQKKIFQDDSTKIITFDELRNLIFNGGIIKHLFRYKEAQLLTYYIDFIPYPFFTACLLRLLSRGKSYIKDERGQNQQITLTLLLKFFNNLLKDLFNKTKQVVRVSNEVDKLSEEYNASKNERKKLDLSKTPVYLRTDLWFGVNSGGSVGHIAGVLNQIGCFSGKPLFITTDKVPTVRADIETHLLSPGKSFWDFREILSLILNDSFEKQLYLLLQNKNISFVYQRYSTNNYSGLKLAKAFDVPFILEYNGSQIWISRHWGRPLKYESLSERIELLNLRAADLIVVVSQPMMDELVERGIDKNKILVNPNGVDPERYSPAVDSSIIRQKFNLSGKIVIGFIGTFGKWHGAEILAEAYGLLMQEFPDFRKRLCLLMIGDGATMTQVRELLTKFNVIDTCILTGLVPQEDGPAYLAACDILVSPHVPNPDGTPFFGSPTKLFEYIAMGRGIVASDLEQIGEVLDHGSTAWMVKPGDVESLMNGLKTLINDEQLRNRLGLAARHEVVANYSWKEHTRKIIEKLKDRCSIVV